MNWIARRLGAADAAAYRDIRLEALQAEPTAFGSDFAHEKPRPLEQWAEQLDRNFSFGVFDGGQLMGIASFVPGGLDKTRHRASLVGVYLRPAARGTGASAILLDCLIETARQHVLQLHLTVTQTNERARRLYERHGFRIYGQDPRGLLVDGVFYDEYLMVLRLDEGGGK